MYNYRYSIIEPFELGNFGSASPFAKIIFLPLGTLLGGGFIGIKFHIAVCTVRAQFLVMKFSHELLRMSIKFRVYPICRNMQIGDKHKDESNLKHPSRVKPENSKSIVFIKDISFFCVKK